MRTIVFYISDHGFGHVSRNIPIIRYILEGYSDIKIVVKTGEAQGLFIKNVLKEYKSRLTIYFEKTDVGLLLKSNSLEIDKEPLEKELIKYINTWDNRSIRENDFLKEKSVNLVVSDIVPWIFKSTHKLNIPSVLISNFTWFDIYKEYFNDNICDEYINVYKLAKKSLLYFLYNSDMKNYLNDIEEVGLCCREFDSKKIKKIKEQYKRKIVFISVGRSVDLKDTINVEDLNYDFIVTEGINIVGSNVTYLSKETINTQDYIKASDYIITKAGWGTISEILCANKKCAVLSREFIAEDRNTLRKLMAMNLAVKIDYKKVFDIEDIVKKLDELNKENASYKFKNEYKNIADKIISYMKEG